MRRPVLPCTSGLRTEEGGGGCNRYHYRYYRSYRYCCCHCRLYSYYTRPTPPNTTHRLLSSSFLGLRYRILHINHKKELLKSLSVPLQHSTTVRVRKVWPATLSSCADMRMGAASRTSRNTTFGISKRRTKLKQSCTYPNQCYPKMLTM